MGKKTIVIGEEEDDEKEREEFEEHPLFPLEENQPSFDVSYIQITRWEEGKQKWGPCIRAEDLKSEADIIAQFGGGDYVLVARAATKLQGLPGGTRKHRRLNLPGLPKPLSNEPTPAEVRLSNPSAPVPGQPVAPASPLSHDPMAFLTLMLEKERMASEKAQQQQNQFMQMFMAIMQGSKSDSQNMMQMMMQMSQQSQASMLQFITAMMSNRGGGPEEMAKYAELLKALGVGASQPAKSEGGTGGIAGMLENAADVIQGLAILKGVGGNGQNGAPAALQSPSTDIPSGTGGASSLLRGLR